MASRRQQVGDTPLRNRLVLHRFICHEFGYLEDMAEMLGRLHGLSATSLDTGDESKYATALLLYRNEDRARTPPEQFIEYDANIAALSSRLRMTGEHGRTWKPYQYLALLFTEHYLNRYFDDSEKLRAELNEAKGFSINYLSFFPLCCLNNAREETACCYCLSAWNQTAT